MATLADLLGQRLEKLRRNADGSFQARCPCCALQGHDKGGEHLRVWVDGSFHCVVGSDDGGGSHNRAVRAWIYQGGDAATLALMELTVIDPEPKLTADTIYPESMLTRMVPDHSYWVGRKVNEDVLRRLEGGLVPAEPRGKLSNRYCFPVRDHASKRIVGWTGRLVSEASFGPKWKHLVKVSRCVYPLTANEAAIRRARKVVLIESVGNGLALSSTGIDNWIVLLGLNVNSRLLGWLVGANLDEVIVSTDNDAMDASKGHSAGNDKAVQIRDKLARYLGEHKVRVRLVQTRNDWCKVLEDGTGELEVFKAELEGTATVVPLDEPAPAVQPETFTL